MPPLLSPLRHRHSMTPPKFHHITILPPKFHHIAIPPQSTTLNNFSSPSRLDLPILNNFSLNVVAGKILVLVGSSGSGKSTVVSLIERFHDLISGEVLLDGQHIGLVNQESALSTATVRENLLLGREFEKAAHSFIIKLPGYDFQVCRHYIIFLFTDILKHAHDNVFNAVSEVCAKLSKTGINATKSGKLFSEVSTIIYGKPYQGALDLLIHVYKKRFSTNGYLIDTSRIDEKNAACMKIKRVEKFILEVGTYEEKIFQKRYNIKQAMIQRFIKEAEKEHIDLNCNNPVKNLAVSCAPSAISEEEKLSNAIANTKKLKKQLKCVIPSNFDLYKNGLHDNDKVKLGCDGWKARYYKEKFSANNEIEVECKRREVVEKYIEGLCWTLQYYFSDVCSWSWYYPFYYAPFASDLKGLSCPTSAFKYGEPFKPFSQLMAILLPRSSNVLPKAYMNLMKSEDSLLVDFYPKDFEVDTDGRRFVWQGVYKLPFIDEEKLLAATKNVEKDLEMDEAIRNSVGTDRIFVRDSSSLVQARLHDADTFRSKQPAQRNIVFDLTLG